MNFNNLLNQVLDTVQKSGNSALSGKNGNPLNSFGGGALVGSLASMLLKKKGGGSLVKAGSMAALGMLAYKAYQNWQGNQAQAQPQSAFAPVGQIAEDHSRIILRTMIAAASSDGLIDEAEKQMIAKESSADPEAQQWLRPATGGEIAQAVGGDQALAAETYLAARMVCGDLERKEIVFLAQLAQALNLDDKLVDQLEQQLGL